ncbi:MAG: hypothetical protein ACN4GF_03825 [Lentimonas sp.]
MFKKLLLLLTSTLACFNLSAITRYDGNITDAESVDIADLPQFASKASMSTGSTSGSASLLSPEWAVIAGHTVGNVVGATVTVNYQSGGSNHSKTGTSVAAYSGFGGFGDDMMLVQLNSPITEPVAFVSPYNCFDEYDQLGWLIGEGRYGLVGVSGGALSNSDGQHRGATQRLISSQAENNFGTGASVDEQLLHYFIDGDPNAASPNPLTTRYEGGPAPGDSGSPIYMYSRGRFYNVGNNWGVNIGKGFHYNRTSTHLGAIQTASSLDFAYPKNLTPKAVWVAEDLTDTQANLSTVTAWDDRLSILSFSNSADGGAGDPALIENATPTGLASVQFDGNDAMGLSAGENPLAGETAMSIVMVVKPSATGAGLEGSDFGTIGLLDATAGTPNGWSLSYAANGRIGWSLDDPLVTADPVESVFRGGAGNVSINDGNWHVVVATWDGSEISSDNAGDDKNMKLFVDSINHAKRTQGPNYINVARDAVALLLGDSQTNAENGFSGEVAEIRLYSGELQLHEVDRLLTTLGEQYVTGSLGVSFDRPWTDVIEIAAGQSLKLRGSLTGGANSVSWDAFAGPAAVTFSDATSVNTAVSFEAPGTYQLRATASNGVTTGTTDLWVDVYVPGSQSADATEYDVPGNWILSDVGSSANSSSLSEGGSQITVAGRSDGLAIGVGETYDHGQFVWKGVAGDFDFVTSLESLTSAPDSRTGIMVRGGSGPTDATAFIGVSSSGAVYWLTREDGGYWGSLTEQLAPTVSLPQYLKLERRGASITAYLSTDGITYTPFGSPADVTLPGVARVGFFVTSGDDATSVTAIFDNHSLKQVGFAQGSSIQVSSINSTDGYAEYDPTLDGAHEPWVDASQVSGPASLNYFKTSNGHRQVLRAYLPGPGTYRTRLCVDDGNTMTFIEDEDCLDNNLTFEFATDGDSDGWNTTNISGVTITGGTLSATTDSNDPQLSQSGLLFDGSLDQVTVNMRSSVDGAVQLFWIRDGVTGFAGSRSVTANYTGGNSFQNVTFDLSGEGEWIGRQITALRIDPVNGVGTAGATFEIDSIVVSDGSAAKPQTEHAYYFNDDGNFEGWKRAKHIDGDYVLDGVLSGTTTGIDPILTNDVRDFDSDSVESLIVRIRANQSGNLQLFWGTTATPAYAAARSVLTAVNGDDNWQTLRLPLAGNVEWDDTTISTLRLDPINVDATSFVIDAIVLSDGDADDDGMPDAYEETNGLDLLVDDRADDLDGDGQSNGDEYIAGTDPDDASQLYVLTSQSVTISGFEVVLAGKAGRTYELSRKLDLTAPTWTPVDSEVVVSDGTVTLQDSSSFDKAFYQVEVTME